MCSKINKVGTFPYSQWGCKLCGVKKDIKLEAESHCYINHPYSPPR